MALSRLLPCPPKAAAEVLEPEELRAAVREEMRAALGLDDEGAT